MPETLPSGCQITSSGANVQLCPANSYQNGFALTCQSCPVGSSTNTSGNTNIFACACRVGYTLDRPGIGACKPCDVAKFEAVPGPGVCTLCATGQFSGEGAEVCDQDSQAT